MLTFISLFAGIGGFDLGLEQAGMRCVAQVEIDPAAQGVLARHWPDVPRFVDVRECGAHNLPRADVLCGGFPCQDLSVAGKRAGLAGARSGLFYEMTRIANEQRPAFILWENVPGLLSSRGGRDFLAVLLELERIGYCGCWTTLDAQFFGLAQRRQRIFGLFARRDIGATRCAEILSLAARVPWNTTPRRAARQGAPADVAGRLGGNGGSQPRVGDGDHALIAFDPTQITSAGNYSTPRTGDPSHPLAASAHPPVILFDWRASHTTSAPLRAGAVAGALSVRKQDAAAVVSADGVRNAISAHHGRNSGEDTYISVDLTNGRAGNDVSGTLEAGQDRYNRGQGVLAFTERTRPEGRTLEAQEDLAYALTNPGSGGRTHSRQVAYASGVRRLTPTECERLQGFPDDWTAGQSDSARYRLLGNAVAVDCARWIGLRIIERAQG